MFAILVQAEYKVSRDELIIKLKESGIDTRTFFIPVTDQPICSSDRFFIKNSYEVSRRLSKTGLYLPSGLTITEDEISKVCDQIKKIAYA